MFVFNIKLNKNKLFRIFFVGICIIVIVILFSSVYKVFTNNKTVHVEDIISKSNVSTITNANYTNILKSVHDDLDTYIGQKINFSGYVYRVYDLEDNQFVLARDMVINSDFQTLVVGFLCNLSDAKNYTDGTWVNITGKIIKGYYHGEIPVIDIEEIKNIEKPSDEFVYPPDDCYIPTSAIMD